MEAGHKLGRQLISDNGIVHQNAHNAQVFDDYLTFCAVGGLSMDEDGEINQLTVKQFAQDAGIARSILYYWKANVPNFWQLVDERARKVFNQSTKFAIMKGLRLKAMAGDTKAAEMVLSHYSDYTPPAQKHEVKLGGWGDVVREARKATIKAKKPPVEGEVVNAKPAPGITDPSNPSRAGGIIIPQATGREHGPELVIPLSHQASTGVSINKEQGTEPPDINRPHVPLTQPVITGPLNAARQ